MPPVTTTALAAPTSTLPEALNGERLRLLTDARRAGLQLESVVEAFVRPALARIQGRDGLNRFSRLRAMLAAEDAPLTAAVLPGAPAAQRRRSGIDEAAGFRCVTPATAR